MRRKRLESEQLTFSLPGVDQVLAALPKAAGEMVASLLREPIVGSRELDNELIQYRQRLEDQALSAEFMDIGLARTLIRRCQKLVAGIASHTPEQDQRLIQVAVRYLILDEDSESDTDSPIGFDDDALVIELVAKAVGREDVLEIE